MVDEPTGRAFLPERLVPGVDMLIAYLDDGWTSTSMGALTVRADALVACGGAVASFRTDV